MKLPTRLRPALAIRCGLTILLMLPTLALALLPPMEVECCQRKDFTSAQCARFALDTAKCEKANASWQETFRRISEMQNPKKAAAKPVLAVARIEPRLYYQHTGSYSEILGESSRLFNVIIGEGGAAEPSSTLRVDVVLTGEPGKLYENAEVKLEVTDTETGKRLPAHSARTGVFSERGEYHVTFLLQNTGCIPLRLVASATGSPTRQSVAIPFLCGE